MFSVLVVVLRPDHIAGQGIEKIVRNEIFKEIWNRSSASIKESRPPLRDGAIVFGCLIS
jgi:hypothetical protein